MRAIFLTLLSLLLSVFVEGKFRPKLAWTSRPQWASYELFQISHDYIKIAWKPAENNGF